MTNWSEVFVAEFNGPNCVHCGRWIVSGDRVRRELMLPAGVALMRHDVCPPKIELIKLEKRSIGRRWAAQKDGSIVYVSGQKERARGVVEYLLQLDRDRVRFRTTS